MLNMQFNSFPELSGVLSYCDKLMLVHQTHLMRKDYIAAFAAFEELYNIRLAHLDLMEKSWLEAYKKILDEFPAGGRPVYFLREKKLILRDLQKYVKLTSNFALQGPDKGFKLVELFEGYIWFKDLLDHHDAREKAFLFPALEDNLENPLKKQMLKQINAVYNKIALKNIIADE